MFFKEFHKIRENENRKFKKCKKIGLTEKTRFIAPILNDPIHYILLLRKQCAKNYMDILSL